MIKTAIIIPSRLEAQRFPNKPLELINNKEMVVHVYDAAIKSNSGDVYVATPDQKIINTIKVSGGKAIKTTEKTVVTATTFNLDKRIDNTSSNVASLDMVRRYFIFNYTRIKNEKSIFTNKTRHCPGE